ncbi:hypothetical protein [Chondromyces crocatus]|uniref:Uncharacterized protein n=1 Tax=Chondromyces crocatus TaxID=52 RepID=A0A0K1EA62_CHOCO|nr:hypothetical protein [Chondromyces crocatus]AKT37739.1 uncharacterized protein CMC5_018810 [Chondromyces crocatus]
MPIPWTSAQRQTVTSVLCKYPPKSGWCVEATREILPVAREHDVKAGAVRIEPAGRARFVSPKVPLDGEFWFFHVTAEAVAHYVDVLTGCDGTSVDAYFKAHWQVEERDAYRVFSVDLEENGCP